MVLTIDLSFSKVCQYGFRSVICSEKKDVRRIVLFKGDILYKSKKIGESSLIMIPMPIGVQITKWNQVVRFKIRYENQIRQKRFSLTFKPEG